MAIKLKKYLFLFFSVIFLLGCGNDTKTVTSTGGSITEFSNKYNVIVDTINGSLTKLKFVYSLEGNPYIFSLEDDTSLTLYFWKEGWNRKNLLSGVTVTNFQPMISSGKIIIFYTFISGDVNRFGKIVYNIVNDELKIESLNFATNPRYFSVINNAGIISVFYVENDVMQLIEADFVDEQWYVDVIDNGKTSGLKGTFYYLPSVTVQADKKTVLYFDTSNPSLRLATLGLGGWERQKLPLTSDIVPAPEFNVKINSWGGTDTVFQNSLTGDLYYAIYATGWTIAPIVKSRNYTGYSPRIFYFGNKMVVFYYNLSFNDIRVSVKTHPFFNSVGEYTTEWKEYQLPIGGKININYSLSKLPNANDRFGLSFYDDETERIYFREFSLNGVVR